MNKHREGYNAYNDNRPASSCPYHWSTEQASAWHEGWLEAQADDESSTNES